MVGKKLQFIILLFLLLPVKTGASILIGSPTLKVSGYDTSQVFTFGHEVEFNTKLLVVTVSNWLDAGPAGKVTNVLINGTSFTKATSTTQGNMNSEIWYLVNPLPGNATIRVNTNGITDASKIMALNIFGAASSPLDQVAGSTDGGGGGTSASTDITPTENGEIIIDTITSYTGTNPTNGQTTLYADTTNSINSGSSYYIQSTAGLKTMTQSWTVSHDYAHAVASFKTGPEWVFQGAVLEEGVILNENVIFYSL